MLPSGNKNRKSKAQVLSRRVVQRYAQKTKQGQRIEVYDDGNSKFDRVCGKLGDIEEGVRVCLANDKSCTGAVKWIGRYHADPGTDNDEKCYIVGVKMDSTRGAYQHQCSHGDLDGEYIVPSTTKNILFKYFPEWVPIKGSAGGAAGAKKSKHFAEKADDTCNGLVHQSPLSKFDRMDLDVNGFHVGSIVKLDTGSVGTVRWIGCYHKKVVKLSDYIVGVELDSTAREHLTLLTNGLYEGEIVVESTKNNIKFTKLKNLSHETSAAAKELWSTVYTIDGIPIEIYHGSKSSFDRVRYGIAGIQYDDRVYLYSDKNRTGTVKWIGCDHGKASMKAPTEFFIGIEMKNPEVEHPQTLTDGVLDGEQLVDTKRRNVIFTTLKFCCLIGPERESDTTGDTKTPRKERLSTVCTVDGIQVEIYHDSKSAFDRVSSGIAGIQDGDKVYLSSDKTRTGTVKWIGCDHGKASNTDPKDFLVGVEVDKPEKEKASVLTNGNYYGEQLVTSAKRNVRFTKLKYWTLVDSESKPLTTDTKSQPSGTLKRETIWNGYQIELYHDGQSAFDKACSDVAGIRDDDNVQLYSDKSITGTVKWIGCFHGTASETDPNDFLVGVQVDKPEDKYPEHPTDGTCYGERLVNSQNKNIVFTTLNYWSLAEQTDMRPASTDVTQHHNDVPKSRQPFKKTNSSPIQHTPLTGHTKQTTHGKGTVCSPGAAVQSVPQQPIPAKALEKKAGADVYIENDHQRLVGMKEKVETEIGKLCSENVVASRNIRGDISHLPFSDSSEPSRVLSSDQDVPKSRQPSKKTNSSPIQPTPLTGHTKQATHGNGTVCSPGAAVQSVPQQPIPATALEKKAGADVYIENDHRKLVGMKEKVETEIGKLCSENVVASRNIRGDISHLPFSDSSEPSRVLSSNQVVRALEDESGAFDDFVNEYVLPPMHCEEYRGYWRGVQGDANSSYMDASLFAMFSYLTVFDSILFKGNAPSGHSTDEHIKRTDDIRSVLRTQIVSPLRKYGLAHQQGIRQLRRLLDEGCLSAVEKDPEEFLNHLLVEMFCTPSPIVLSDGQESHLFHLLEQKAEGMDFPTIQELVERTCLQQNIKFQKIPPYLILRLPTFGKDRKVYEKILPSLELDITDMLTESTQSCYVCGYAATHQCCGCYDISHKISRSTFCSDCTEDYHKSPHRREHKPQKLVVADKGDGLSSPKCVLKLAAAICTKASHYVSFVATDTTADAKWYFFDNMADRDGATDVPQVTEIMGFRKQLRDAKSANNLPLPVRRLIKDGHMCLYVNPEVPQFKPTDAPLKIITPNGTSKV